MEMVRLPLASRAWYGLAAFNAANPVGSASAAGNR